MSGNDNEGGGEMIKVNEAGMRFVLNMQTAQTMHAEHSAEELVKATKDAAEYKTLVGLLFKRLRQYVPRGLCVMCCMPALPPRVPNQDILLCNACAGVVQKAVGDAQVREVGDVLAGLTVHAQELEASFGTVL